MQLPFLTAIGFLLFLIGTPALAQEPVREAMAVYRHIARTEAMIDLCRRLDAAEANSYDKMFQKYEADIAGTVVKIGLLVGQRAKEAGIDKDSLLDSLDNFLEIVVEQLKTISSNNLDEFVKECRTLPKAMGAKTTPFEPLSKRFPDEMSVIEGGP